MKLTVKGEKLLKQYLAELEKHLPLLKARDIIRERESDFLDMLEDQADESTTEISEDQVKTLLNKMGAPETMAREYHSRNYFIGPELYPVFSLVVKIVGAVLISMALIGGLVFPETMAPLGWGNYLLTVLNALFNAFGWICAVFFILGFFRAKINLEDKWDVSQLSAIDHDEYPGTIWLAIFMGFLIISALVLHFFNNHFPLFFNTNGQVVIKHFELVGFEKLLPWFTLFLGLRAIHTGFLLYFKKWNYSLHLSNILIKVIGSVFPLALFIMGFNLQLLSEYSETNSAVLSVLEVFTQLGRVGMLVITAAMIISAGIETFKMFTKRKAPV
ncbi:MAG: hypothetical protein JXR70_17585 [Spirochaetales bacterium]|nr:hypothetical protein [Spirochaetales bacterium]